MYVKGTKGLVHGAVGGYEVRFTSWLEAVTDEMAEAIRIMDDIMVQTGLRRDTID